MSFDLYLVHPDGSEIDRERLVDALVAERLVHLDRADPERLVYRRPDTSVYFSMLLDRPLARAVLRRVDPAAAEAAQAADAEAEAEAEYEDEDDDERTEGDEAAGAGSEAPGEEEPDADHPVELPPVTINVPFFHPTFFLVEALSLAGRLAAASGAVVTHQRIEATVPAGEQPGPAEKTRPAAAPETSAAPAGTVPPAIESILGLWAAENRVAFAQLKTPIAIAVWPLEASQAWWAWGDARARLAAELANDQVEVPILQLAQQGDRVRTLVAWNVAEPTALPRSDLVLVRRERTKKGLLLTRRVVEEGLVEGSRIWNLLAPFAEVRREPAEVLIFREARKPPSQVLAELEVLRLEPVESARRVGLLGVMELDPRSS